MPLRPPLPSSWLPRAPQSAQQSCSVWNSWPKSCRPRSEEMRARTRSSKYFGKGRMLRAYPKLRHGEKHRSLDELRERLKYERKH